MELKLEKFVEDLKEYNASEIKCEFDFAREGELYHFSISVQKHEEQKNDNSEN